MAEVVETELSDPASILEEIEQPGVGPMLSAASPWRWGGEQMRPTPAPSMSADTDDVLSELLGLSQRDLGRLRDARIIG
jgi:2-methylfumaryl-CoA isomerase